MDSCCRFNPRTSNPGSGPRLQAHADSGRTADVHTLEHGSTLLSKKKEKGSAHGAEKKKHGQLRVKEGTRIAKREGLET